MRMAYLAKVAFEVCSLLHLLNCLLFRAQGKWGRDFLRDLGSCKGIYTQCFFLFKMKSSGVCGCGSIARVLA